MYWLGEVPRGSVPPNYDLDKLRAAEPKKIIVDARLPPVILGHEQEP